MKLTWARRKIWAWMDGIWSSSFLSKKRTAGTYKPGGGGVDMDEVSRPLSPSIMLSFFKRRIYSVLNSQKTEIYGLRNPRQLEATRPAHRRFTTFLASGSLRRRYTMPSYATLRHLHVRAISYSSIPRFVARAFRVPIAGATVGVGGFGYANYKFEGRSLL